MDRTDTANQAHGAAAALEQSVCSLEANHVIAWDEIASLTAETGNPAETLMNVVALIARRFGVDVCSAYLLEPDRANLVLAATVGLNPACIGQLRMGVQEGLTGLVAEQVRPVAVEQVEKHPRFKYFPELGEDPYQVVSGRAADRSRRAAGRAGHPDGRGADVSGERDQMLQEAAARVAPVVSEARTLDRFIAPVQERMWALARNFWWSWDHDAAELFPRTRSASLEPAES